MAEPLALAADLDAATERREARGRKMPRHNRRAFTLMQKRYQEFAFRSMAEMLRFLAVSYELKPTRRLGLEGCDGRTDSSKDSSQAPRI